jgi:hypothetical protein
MDTFTVMKTTVMVFACAFSRYPEAHIFDRSPSSRDVADAFVRKVISRHGCPSKLYADGVSYQRFGDFPALCDRLGVQLLHTTSYNPALNGVIESKVKVIKQLIRSLAVEQPLHWNQMLPLALLVYRCSFHRGLGDTPHYLNTGRSCTLPGVLNRVVRNLLQETEVANPSAYAENLVAWMQEAYAVATHNLQGSSDLLNRQALLPEYFVVGDVVMLFTPK